jgi:hypothetical protein
VPHTSNLKKEKRRRKKLIFNFNFFNLRKKRKKGQKMKSRVVVIELAHKTTLWISRLAGMWTFAPYQKHDSKTKFWGVGFGLSQTVVFCVFFDPKPITKVLLLICRTTVGNPQEQ